MSQPVMDKPGAIRKNAAPKCAGELPNDFPSVLLGSLDANGYEKFTRTFPWRDFSKIKNIPQSIINAGQYSNGDICWLHSETRICVGVRRAVINGGRGML